MNSKKSKKYNTQSRNIDNNKVENAASQAISMNTRKKKGPISNENGSIKSKGKKRKISGVEVENQFPKKPKKILQRDVIEPMTKNDTIDNDIEESSENIAMNGKHTRVIDNVEENLKALFGNLSSPPIKKSKKQDKELIEVTHNSTEQATCLDDEVLSKRKRKARIGICKNDPGPSKELSQDSTEQFSNELDEISLKKRKKKHKTSVPISESNSDEIQCTSNNNMQVKHELNIIGINDEIVNEDDENVVTISIKDIEGNDSDWDANDLLKQLENKVEKPKESLIKVKKFIPNWPGEDFTELVNRVDACIPENDCLNYTKRVELLEWDKIAFKNYTVEDCKKTWSYILNKVRRYRYLKEVLEDVKEWVANPKQKTGRPQRHPDQPRRPLSAFFIYYVQKKDNLQAEHPGMDATELAKLCSQDFKQLLPESKEVYEKLAAKNRKEYDQKLKEFYELHPEEIKAKPEKPPKPPKPPKPEKEKSVKPPKEPKPPKEKPLPKEKVPKRALPPFQYFCISEIEKENVEDKGAFKEVCKEKWKQMPDNQKIEWINYAEAENFKYEEEMKVYIKNHPEYVVQKHSLSKENQLVKERLAGKPARPPTSAYNLFVGRLLHSEDIKDVPARDRLTYASDQWKACSEEDKKEYKDLFEKMVEKYKLDYAAYLESLPEEERKTELLKSAPKRRKSDDNRPKKEAKVKKPKPSVPKIKPSATEKKKTEKKKPKKMVEPEQPPISPYKYFITVYQGEEPHKAWKALTSAQKKTYEEELVKKKQAYIVAFEKFLKSMTKEELEAFSNARKKVKQELQDDEDMDSSGESDSDISDDESEITD